MVGYYNKNGDFVNLVQTSADKISFDDTVAQVNADNVQNAIENLQTKLQTNFQAGVDAIYNAVVAEGSTPASHSLNDVVDGIHNIPNKNTEEYDALTRENRKDLGYNNKVRYVTTTHVPNYNSGNSPTPVTANGTKDIGETNSYRYFTINVPNTNTETFPATTREAAKDMGVNNNYRYVNTTGVPNSNSGDCPTQFTTNGRKDIGATASYRYYTVNVPASAVVSGTYTYPVGSTGGTTDITNYKDVNAENVYAKGKADGASEYKGSVSTLFLSDRYSKPDHSEYTFDQDIFTFTCPKAGQIIILYCHLYISNHNTSTNASGRLSISGNEVLYGSIDGSHYVTDKIIRNTTYNVSAGDTVIFHKYINGGYYDGLSSDSLIDLAGVYLPNA